MAQTLQGGQHMSDLTDARDAFLALCGYSGSTLDTPLHRYGVAAPTPDLDWIRMALAEVTKDTDDSPRDRYLWHTVKQRGKPFILIMLVGHFYTSETGYEDGKYFRKYHRHVVVGVGLSPRAGDATPGRAWKALAPWREGNSSRSRDRLRYKVEQWSEEDSPDRVRFELRLLPTMLQALDAEGGTEA
jgi:hypothetical protein